MPEELDRLCAEREALYGEIERLERAEADIETLQPLRSRLGQVLHEINDKSGGNPDL